MRAAPGFLAEVILAVQHASDGMRNLREGEVPGVDVVVDLHVQRPFFEYLRHLSPL